MMHTQYAEECIYRKFVQKGAYTVFCCILQQQCSSWWSVLQQTSLPIFCCNLLNSYSFFSSDKANINLFDICAQQKQTNNKITTIAWAVKLSWLDQGSLVGARMQDYKSLCAAVAICFILINIQTHSFPHIHNADSTWPAYLISSASWAKNHF